MNDNIGPPKRLLPAVLGTLKLQVRKKQKYDEPQKEKCLFATSKENISINDGNIMVVASCADFEELPGMYSSYYDR